MRTNEVIQEELDYLYQGEVNNKTPQNASYDYLTTELLLDCRKILAALAENSGIPIWHKDFQSGLGFDSSQDGA